MAAKKSVPPASEKSPAPAPVKKAAAKKVAAKKAAAKQAPATKSVAKTAATRKTTAAKPQIVVATPNDKARPSREQIAHAAYLNYRGRAEKGLPGDPHTDWLDAERKLL